MNLQNNSNTTRDHQASKRRGGSRGGRGRGRGGQSKAQADYRNVPPPKETEKPRHSAQNVARISSQNLPNNSYAYPWQKELTRLNIQNDEAQELPPQAVGHQTGQSSKLKIQPVEQPKELKQDQKKKGGNRSDMFDEFLSKKQVTVGIKERRLVQGVIRISKKQRRNAYVTVEGYARDFLVVGSRDRNRAMHGDTVVIEFMGECERSKVDDVRGGNQLFPLQEKFAPLPPLDLEAIPVRDEDYIDDEYEDANTLVKVARVVSITLRRPGATFSGFLLPAFWRPGTQSAVVEPSAEIQLRPLNSVSDVSVEVQETIAIGDASDVEVTVEDDGDAQWEDQTDEKVISSKQTLLSTSHEAQQGNDKHCKEPIKKPNNIYFKPMDNRAPLIVLSSDQVPVEFFTSFELYKDKIFVASFQRWPTHCLYPYGTLGKVVGDMGDILAETEAILETNCVRRGKFTEKVVACLPELPFAIPEDEISRRRDLRNARVFTIDPETARDLDDAVSVELLPDGNLSVGVHIADVSYFIKQDSALDVEAQKRATTTYMVQAAYPMLPSVLCEDLCSLNPGVDRLAFSVIWKMTSQAHILETWFGRSVICSCVKMSYQNAQNLIEGLSWDEALEGKIITGNHSEKDITNDVKTFHKLSLLMRQRRFDGGALTINQPKLSFRIDDQMNPVYCSVYEIKDSNRLIEEFMLLANMSVAKKISEAFPEAALLRCHPPPTEKVLKEFMKYAERLGSPMAASSAGELQKSILAIPNQEKRQIFQLLAIKPMQRALYFSTGDTEGNLAKWRHYALNCDMYTHFTSPIRRYADVIVHRQLQAALDMSEQSPIEPKTVTKYAANCNLKKEDARQAQDDSLKLFLCVYLKQISRRSGQPVVEDAIVMDVNTRTIDVYITKFAIDRRIYLEDCGVLKVAMPECRDSVTVTWPLKYRNLPPYQQRFDHKNFKVVVNEEDGSTTTFIDEKIEAGSTDIIPILKKVKVLLTVEGRSPMNIKAYLIYPEFSIKRVEQDFQALSLGHATAFEEAIEESAMSH